MSETASIAQVSTRKKEVNESKGINTAFAQQVSSLSTTLEKPRKEVDDGTLKTDDLSPQRIKTSLSLFTDDIDEIRRLAKIRKSTAASAIRHAIALELHLREEMRDGAIMIIRKHGEPDTKFIFPP
jgi:hypothetical protein